MKKKCKRYIVLLELLISIFLTISLISILTYFYYQMNLINTEMDREQGENFEKRYIENRLAAILPKSIPPNDPSKNFHFFTSNDLGGLLKPGNPSLVFAFDNCVKQNKELAYHVIGRLYLDNSNNLTLATWPAENRWTNTEPPVMNREVLLEGVSSLRFLFFVPPDKGKTEIKKKTNTQERTIPANLRGEWTEEWRGEYRELPAMIKVIVQEIDEEKELIYAFPFPHTTKPITYDQ